MKYIPTRNEKLMHFDTNSEPPTLLSITSPTFNDLSSSPLTPHKDEEQVGSVTHVPEHAERNDKSNCECLGIKLVIDNVNKNVVPRNMTSEQQTKSLHYVHMYRVEDRISIGHLSHDPPERSTSVFSAEVFKSVLLSPNDNETMANYFSLLVPRVLVTPWADLGGGGGGGVTGVATPQTISNATTNRLPHTLAL